MVAAKSLHYEPKRPLSSQIVKFNFGNQLGLGPKGWGFNTHSALFWGLRFTLFCTSTCGIPNWPEWSPRPDFDGLDQNHHWTLRKSQGEAGQGGAHLEGPRCLQLAWKKNFTYKIFLVLQLLLVKFFKFYTIKMEKCQICWFDQLIKSQKEESQAKTFLVKFT